MKNFIQRGVNLTLTAPYARESGEGALVGAIFGVASTDVDVGKEAEFVTEGVFELPKGAGAGAQGQKAYWDDAAKLVTATAAGNTAIGAFIKAAGAAAGPAHVKLTGQVV